MVGASLAPLFLGETSDVGEATIDGGTRGRRSPRWRRYGGLMDQMMVTSASSPPWGQKKGAPMQLLMPCRISVT
jgi:hypothetical protein